ncbi:hypothetical protein ACFVW5_29455 [Streptomyces sp. NPDC058232]|uniref:LmrA/YxaF family transcription factor n=1 Tax=Streptomyces sp. NPDC058232 TaxID=3346393 RepID=UPI0036E098CC
MQHKLPTGRQVRGRGPARRQRALAALFLRHGLPEEWSRRPAAVIIAALEGAVIMCRIEQSRLPPPRPHPARRSDHAHSRPPGQRLRPRPRGR